MSAGQSWDEFAIYYLVKPDGSISRLVADLNLARRLLKQTAGQHPGIRLFKCVEMTDRIAARELHATVTGMDQSLLKFVDFDDA